MLQIFSLFFTRTNMYCLRAFRSECSHALHLIRTLNPFNKKSIRHQSMLCHCYDILLNFNVRSRMLILCMEGQSTTNKFWEPKLVIVGKKKKIWSVFRCIIHMNIDISEYTDKRLCSSGQHHMSRSLLRSVTIPPKTMTLLYDSFSHSWMTYTSRF